MTVLVNIPFTRNSSRKLNRCKNDLFVNHEGKKLLPETEAMLQSYVSDLAVSTEEVFDVQMTHSYNHVVRISELLSLPRF